MVIKRHINQTYNVPLNIITFFRMANSSSPPKDRLKNVTKKVYCYKTDYESPTEKYDDH